MKASDWCWYCDNDGKKTPGVEVVHDGRGCLRVCRAHGQWRKTTSSLAGHKGCPDGHPDGRTGLFG